MSAAGDDFSQVTPIGWSVGELIDALKAYDAAALVVLPAQNAGFIGVHTARPLHLKLYSNAAPDFGPHEVPGKGEMADVAAVVLFPVS